jgi:Holliday junction resolvase RusA-like endonuclease
MDHEALIASLWEAPMIPQGIPVLMGVVAYRGRPSNHYRKSGALGAAGLRNPHPIKRPDLYNIVKLVMDALNGVAFHDDAQVVKLNALSTWAASPGTLITIVEYDVD